jgi:hypothetical protein
MNSSTAFMQGVLSGIAMFTIVFLWLFILAFGPMINHARVQVASGEYQCLLVEAKDQTTDWVCKETSDDGL